MTDINKNILQNMLINSSKTGNPIFDSLLSFLCLTFIAYISKNIVIVKNFFLNIIKNLIISKNYVEIIIEAENIIHEKIGVKLNKLYYSPNFKAVSFFIKELKSHEIYSKREPDICEMKNNSNFNNIFIPDQSKAFLLEPKKEIKCIIELNKDYPLNNDSSKNSCNKSHIIKIFSKNKNTKMHDLENFIEKCVIEYNFYINQKIMDTQYYFSFQYSEDNGEIIYFSEKKFYTNKTFNTIFFEDKEKYIRSLVFFLENKDWYKKKGIPYHFGILLHGLPGCGKTSIIKAILEYTGRHAFVIPLNRVKTCGELENIFYKMEINEKYIPTEKRIYIFEDIDCLCNIVKDRELEDKPSITEFELLDKLTNLTIKKSNDINDELNLSCILNIFDGILETPGRIIILTSNFPEKIDKALLRPGRIDLNIELKKTSSTIVYEMLSFFYDIDISIISKMCNNMIEDYKFTPAEIINICQNNMFDIKECINKLIN